MVTEWFSLLVAVVSGVIAYFSARANFRHDLEKMQAQIDAQRKAEEQDRIADLRQRYLTPLRYYANTLSKRLGELETKFRSPEAERVRGWFKRLKDHVAGDRRMDDFGFWPYYEGIFSVSTLYYACCYFFCAREIRYSQPFLRDSPAYNEDLDKHLAAASASFAGDVGIWEPLQEVIGERFAVDHARLSYEGMCRDLGSDEAPRRGHYLRALDFFWRHLTPEECIRIRNTLESLVAFLDSRSPDGIERARPR